MMSFRHRQRGVTLVELTISIVVIAIAVAAILGVLAMSARSSADAVVRSQALAIATAYLEEAALKPFADPDGVSGETVRATLDDVGDYASVNDTILLGGAKDQLGNAIAGLSQYAVRVNINAGTLPSIANANVYRIDVTVTHASGLTLTVSRYRTNF